jgi:hypothetical protein
MISVLMTAIDVKAKIITTKNGPSQWFSSRSPRSLTRPSS